MPKEKMKTDCIKVKTEKLFSLFYLEKFCREEPTVTKKAVNTHPNNNSAHLLLLF